LKTYTSEEATNMSVKSYGQALSEALSEEMERDPTVFVMGEDVALIGGLFGATAGLLDKFGESRVIDTPISETMIVGAGVGAAITGRRPFVDLQFADFVGVAMDEVVNKAAKWRYMHGGLYKVPLVIAGAIGAMGGAGAEHSQCPEAWLLHTPGLKVALPATPADAKGLLKVAIRDDNPVVFLTHKALIATQGEVPDGDHLVPFGQARIAREGADVTIVTYSHMVHKALEAAEKAAEEGISCEVIDLRTVAPLDMDTVLASVEKTGRLLIAHEAPVTGGVGAEISARVAEQALYSLEAPIKRVCGQDVPIPQSIRLEAMCIPQVKDILAGIRELGRGGTA
jgi:pyruvate dehydrogenase E1 component beta subunit